MFASVIATAAPIAALPALEAVPSATDVASAFSLLFRVSAPPALTITPNGIDAFALTLAIVIETAAATEIPPPLVDADGVTVPPEPEPPFAAAVSLACVRSPCTFESTVSPAGWSGESSAGAPAAEAVAELADDDGPSASKLIAPVALTL